MVAPPAHFPNSIDLPRNENLEIVLFDRSQTQQKYFTQTTSFAYSLSWSFDETQFTQEKYFTQALLECCDGLYIADWFLESSIWFSVFMILGDYYDFIVNSFLILFYFVNIINQLNVIPEPLYIVELFRICVLWFE